ncbi:hypothetical protein [Rheinheimera soli]|uniref:hypothetical protein n=1 Tax=Rheinheimera soli TaxID=443616 RepID=UPI001E5D34AB|nr:hypothetical protein [Rheinheimera soli]
MGDDNLLKWLVGTLFSGLGTTWLSEYLNRSRLSNNSAEFESREIRESSVQEEKSEDYKTRLGARHKFIRTTLLKLSDRRMADFYKFDTVSELLEFEAGVKEFPISLLNTLCDFFFLKKEMFDLDNSVRLPFKSFSLHRDEIEQFLKDGFRPVIACSPESRETDLYCSIMMCKAESSFYRVVSSDVRGRFKSGGGGKSNLEQLIHAMIKTGKYDTEARIVQVDKDLWSKIESREFCQNIENHDLDWDCQDIFDKWYFQYDKKFGNELRSQWIKEYHAGEEAR